MARVTETPVCVTGASGFIASRLVSDLLERGYTVRGTVRDASQKEKYDYLTQLPGADQRLELVSADLMQPESFAPAVAGCEYVLHTASPYVVTVDDPQTELVDPAVKGTRAVLDAVAATPEVKRVVLTSSVAAISDEPTTGKRFSEEDWNNDSSLKRNPYYYSKVCAERSAWEFLQESERQFDMVAINPSLVLGPSLTSSLNESNKILVDLLSGAYPGIISVAWGMVDVRDVSLAHILAMENGGAEGRYLCSNDTISMREMVKLLHELGYSQYKLPKLGLDNAFGSGIVKIASIFQPSGVRSYLRTNLNRLPKYDNSKIKAELGMEFRALRDSVKDLVEDLFRWGHVERREARSQATTKSQL